MIRIGKLHVYGGLPGFLPAYQRRPWAAIQRVPFGLSFRFSWRDFHPFLNVQWARAPLSSAILESQGYPRP